MGERKVLNKYYPPDFDPAAIPKKKQAKNRQIKVRFMLPCSVRCNTCGEYLYKGKKFNCRKEDVIGEKYLGIQIFRFYIKCTMCSSEITIKTDPEHSDYVCEFGASRNFEPWREVQVEEEEAKKAREEEEKGDAMKALENRTLASKREIDILDALDEIRMMSNAHAKIDKEDVLRQHWQKDIDDKDTILRKIQQEEDQQVEAVFRKGLGQLVKRIEEEDDDEEEEENGDDVYVELGDDPGGFSAVKKMKQGQSSSSTPILSSSLSDTAHTSPAPAPTLSANSSSPAPDPLVTTVAAISFLKPPDARPPPQPTVVVVKRKKDPKTSLDPTSKRGKVDPPIPTPSTTAPIHTPSSSSSSSISRPSPAPTGLLSLANYGSDGSSDGGGTP